MCFISGCANMSSFKEYKVKEIKQCEIDKYNESEQHEKGHDLNPGEKLYYEVFWTGVPAGEVVLKVESKTSFNNKKVFKLVGKARTNKVFSVLYNIKDVFKSYMDRERERSRGYELIRKGRGRKKEKVVFNYEKRKAYILLKGEQKKKDIPSRIQDPLSSLYRFRQKDIKVGDCIIMDVHVDEKNWKVEYNVKKFGKFNLVNLGVSNAFLVDLVIKHKGKVRKDRKVKIWLSADKKKIPLLITIDVPIGYMKAVLVEHES